MNTPLKHSMRAIAGVTLLLALACPMVSSEKPKGKDAAAVDERYTPQGCASGRRKADRLGVAVMTLRLRFSAPPKKWSAFRSQDQEIAAPLNADRTNEGPEHEKNSDDLVTALSHLGVIHGAELRVFTSRAIAIVLDKIGPEFESTTGHKLIVTVGFSTSFVEQINRGEPFDVVVCPPRTLDGLIKGNKVIADTRTNLVRSAVGVGVLAGAPKPDISTVDKLIRALLNAKSIGYNSTSSPLMDELGISDVIKSKVAIPPTDIASELVAKGELELVVVAMTQILTTPGVELVGPLPREILRYAQFAAGVSADSKAPSAARELIKFLIGPIAIPVIKSQGMERVE